MRSRKSFFSLGIIVLVLFLGVGYAVVSSVYLNIGGTASVANADLKVEITNAVASTSVSGKTVDFSHTLSSDKLSSNFTLNGMELNETVSITYTVTNNETDVDAVLSGTSVDLTNSNSDFFDVDFEITDAETDLENNDKTMEVVVNVSLIQTPVAESEGITTVGLKLTASPKGGSGGTNSGPVEEATEVYYNQPYNTVITSAQYEAEMTAYAYNNELVASPLNTVMATPSYNNLMNSKQMVAKNLAETEVEHIKTMVIYDDHTVDIFIDGTLHKSYPAGSASIDELSLSVDEVFDGQISRDYKKITIGDEIFEVNTKQSSLKVGPGHVYAGAYVKDYEHDMAIAVAFKDNTRLDVYFNGFLMGEAITNYFTIGNVIYIQEDGEDAEPYAYVSIDGTQIIQKGKFLLKYQGSEELLYGRAYSSYGSYDEDPDPDKMTVIIYRDGSADIIQDYLLVEKIPVGTIKVQNNRIFLPLGEEGVDEISFIVKNDGYSLVICLNDVETGLGLGIDDIYNYSINANKKFNLINNGNIVDTVIFDDTRTYTTTSGKIGEFAVSPKTLVLDEYPYLFIFDENTGEYFCNVNIDDEVGVLKLVPVQ